MRVWPPRQTEPMAPVTLSKDPLAHISDREEVHTALVSGGQVGVSLGPAHVDAELRALRPTQLSATPRFFEALQARSPATSRLLPPSHTFSHLLLLRGAAGRV